MTTRLQATYEDQSGVKYSLLIYDRDYVGETITLFKCKADSIVLSHEGDANDPFKRICPAKLEWTMFLNLGGTNGYTSEERTEIQLFYSDITTSYEGRFYCTLRENILGGKILFRGKILADIGDLVLNYEKEVKLTAVDGLSVLKDVPYRPDEYSDTVAEDAIKTYTFNSHFNQILKKSDVNKFFYEDFTLNGVGDVLWTTAANWTESKSVAGDIFGQVRKRNTYFKTISQSYRKYFSCYEALSDLLTGFNARIIFSDGVYHVEQLGYLDNSTLTRYKYKYSGLSDGSYGNKTTYDITNNDDIKILQTPTKRILPPFKAVELIQSKQFTNYLNGFNVSSDLNPGPHVFGDVIATGSKLVLQYLFQFYNLGSEPTFVSDYVYLHRIELEFEIKIDDGVNVYYMKSLGNTFVNFDLSNIFAPIQNAEWSLTPGTVKFSIEKDFQETVEDDYVANVGAWFGRIQKTFWVVESLEVQNDGVLSLEVIDWDYTVDSTPVDIDFKLLPQSRMIFASGYNDLYELPEEISIFEVGDIRNTIIYELKFDYFDSSFKAFKQLFIKNSTYVTTDEATVEWTDSDMGETLPIQLLCMKQVLGMRAKPTHTYTMSLINLDDVPFTFDNRFLFEDDLYIPLTLSHDITNGVYRFTLYKVFKDYTGIDQIPINEPSTEVPPYPIPDGSLGSAYGNNSGISGVQYWEEWENVAVNYVEVSILTTLIYGLSETEIKKKCFLYVNGVKFRYLDDTLVLSTFKFDTSTNRIYYFKGSGNVRHIEFYRYY